MRVIFLNALVRARGAILGWGICLAVLGAYVMGLYDAVMAQQVQYTALVSNYPPELLAAFGDFNDMFSPGGYLHFTMMSYLPLVFGFYAIAAGAGLVAADEEKGTLDLLLAHPVSRSRVFWGRVLAHLCVVMIIFVIAWLGLAAVAPRTDMPYGWMDLWLPFLSLFSLMILFSMAALLLSMFLPSQSAASTISLLLLAGSYLLITLQRLQPDVKNLAQWTPMAYYQGGHAVEGLNWGWLLRLMGAASLFAVGAWMRFLGRDLRLGGEGGLSLGFFRKGVTKRKTE